MSEAPEKPAPGADSEPASATEWARLLKADWEQRARSDSRDFFVASHAGWNDPRAWERQARSDVSQMLYRLDPEAMGDWQVLEIGCGVGRLARPLLAIAGGYTGFDISSSMVEEARRRCADLEAARFFVSDGLGVPAEIADRRYQLVLSLAVFIHCPRDLVASLVRGAWPLVAPGGQLRFQLRADPEDPTGVISMEQAEALHAEMQAVEDEVVTSEASELIEDRAYMGHAFRYDEVEPFLAELTGGAVTLMRVDLANHYGWIEKAPLA